MIGLVVASIRMTDDRQGTDKLKLKRISDGTVFFVPQDSEKPYAVGDIYFENVDGGIFGTTQEEFVVIAQFKTK